MEKKLKVTKAYKDYTRDLCYRLKEYFDMQQWTLSIEWHREQKYDPIDGHAEVVADISMNQDYLYLTIRMYPTLLKMYNDKDYKDIFETLVHEYCHTLIDPVYLELLEHVNTKDPMKFRFINRLRESSVQRTTNIILQNFQPSYYLPKEKKKPKKKKK